MSNEEDMKALAEYEAECMWVSHNYQPLIDLQEAVDERNKHFEESCREVMKELEEENFGDM